MAGLLIRNGAVVDGQGTPARPGDVRVADGRIIEVGIGLRADGETELDASGAYVTPGFIDTHTHFDPSLFWDPTCDPMPQHGVTSVVTGNCSLSLAPVRSDARHKITSLFCYIEDMPEAAFDAAIPWSWEGYDEYLDEMSKQSYGVNVASLVGHNLLRLYVMGEEAWDRPSTVDERARIVALLDDCLQAGAFGMSTSLGFDEDRNKRPVPTRVADDDEFSALFERLASRGRILEFIASPVPKYLTRDVRRVADLGRPFDLVSTWISIFYDEQRPDYALSVLDFAAELQADGARCYPQVSPRTLDIRVNWSGGMSFYTLANGWHRAVQADPEEKRRLLADPEWRAIAREEWDRVPFTMIRHKLPQHIRLISVTRPENRKWLGSTLAELVADRGAHPSDVLADWVLENDLAPGVVGVGIANSDPDGVAETLRHPAAVISNSDAGAHLQMLCAYGDSTLLLTRHVRDRGDFTLEAAVRELTSRQAELFGFHERGKIAQGAIADLTIFSLDDLCWSPDVFVHDLPNGAARLRRPPGGYRYTIVNGAVTQEAGELTGRRPGTLLRGGS